jgi:endonuclease YncB( thermonuclease family)
MRRVFVLVALSVLLAAPAAFAKAPAAHVYRIARVVDGDTVYLTNGAKIRLVQIDTPEVYFGAECWGHQASAETSRLLPVGTLVRLASEPATDSVDRYGRLLRYVFRIRDGLNVNVFLVRHGDAAPYFYGGREGRYAGLLKRSALRARASRRGLWGACRRTPVDFYRGVDTGPAT